MNVFETRMARKMMTIFGRKSAAFHLDTVGFGERHTKIISEVKDPAQQSLINFCIHPFLFRFLSLILARAGEHDRLSSRVLWIMEDLSGFLGQTRSEILVV